VAEHLGPAGATLTSADLDTAAQRFRLTPGQIANACGLARSRARWHAVADAKVQATVPKGIEPTLDHLQQAARAQSGHALARLARKLTPKYQWTDLILPEDQRSQLQEICLQFRYRTTVYGDWGFDRKLSLGKGLNVLFSGPPGTGKTMAAEVIANALGLDLYKIDLSQVVSKYIGDTEKNLDRIFAAAEDANAILFFDEADALFGKRSEVKDAHDRYANIEVGYLLQKMEEYEGIAILATNLKGHLDEAFVRRMQAIVEFPFPDEDHRRHIWKVVFPGDAPLGEDVDFDRLAREVRLAGGNIKNIGLASAFYAASDGGVIHMSHLLRAVYREHQKLGRTWNGWNGALP
jgi:SpoVK/Ycf46/Vps4 family AAA+-type ATPase